MELPVLYMYVLSLSCQDEVKLIYDARKVDTEQAMSRSGQTTTLVEKKKTQKQFISKNIFMALLKIMQ